MPKYRVVSTEPKYINLAIVGIMTDDVTETFDEARRLKDLTAFLAANTLMTSFDYKYRNTTINWTTTYLLSSNGQHYNLLMLAYLQGREVYTVFLDHIVNNHGIAKEHKKLNLAAFMDFLYDKSDPADHELFKELLLINEKIDFINATFTYDEKKGYSRDGKVVTLLARRVEQAEKDEFLAHRIKQLISHGARIDTRYQDTDVALEAARRKSKFVQLLTCEAFIFEATKSYANNKQVDVYASSLEAALHDFAYFIDRINEYLEKAIKQPLNLSDKTDYRFILTFIKAAHIGLCSLGEQEVALKTAFKQKVILHLNAYHFDAEMTHAPKLFSTLEEMRGFLHNPVFPALAEHAPNLQLMGGDNGCIKKTLVASIVPVSLFTAAVLPSEVNKSSDDTCNSPSLKRQRVGSPQI